MEENLLPRLAREPYLDLETGNSRPFIPPYQINETTDSIYNNEPPMIPSDLKQKLTNLENAMQMIYDPVRFQGNKLQPGPKKAIHDGSFPIWLSQLPDPTIHPYSLVPFPNAEAVDLPDILQHCLDYRVLPDRTAWVLHSIIYKANSQHDLIVDIKNNLEGNNSPENIDNLWKLTKFCYNRNILNHSVFLNMLVDLNNINAIQIFKDQIFQIHPLVNKILNNKKNSFNIFQEEFLTQKSHLIQFSVLTNFLPQMENFKLRFNHLIEQNMSLMRRSKNLYKTITQTRLPYTILLRNCLINSYPFYDLKKFAIEIDKTTVFMKKEDSDIVGIGLLEVLFWFEENSITLPAAIAFILSRLSLTREFLDLFIEFVYDNCDRIKPIRYLFSELQNMNILTYTLFIKRIKQLGYFITEKEKTKIVIENFPFVGRSIQNVTAFSDAMKKIDSLEYDQILQSFLEEKENRDQENVQKSSNPYQRMAAVSNKPTRFSTQENISNLSKDGFQLEKIILEKIDLAKELPYSAAYGLCSYIISITTNFADASEILFRLNVDLLFPSLLDRLKEKNIPFNLTRIILPRIIKVVPLIALYGKLKILSEKVSQNLPQQIHTELGIYIQEHYKKIIEDNLVKNAKNAKQIVINSEKIRTLFREYSYLCSLHIFDALHGIESLHDFEPIFKRFLTNLLQFKSLKSKILLKFFISFCQSNCITRPVNYFIKSMLNVLLAFPEEEFTDRLNSLLEEFFTEVFSRGMFLPSSFLSDCKKARQGKTNSNAKILQVFLEIVRNNPHLFTPQNCLSDHSIKNFIQEPQQLYMLIQELRNNHKLPQLTDDLLDQFCASTTKPISLTACYFALLPDEARDPDLNKAFQFYVENADHENTRFLAYWLKYYCCYNQGTPQIPPEEFPVTLINEKPGTHPLALSQLFFDLFNGLDKDSPDSLEMSRVYLNGWSLVCQTDKSRSYSTPLFANEAIKIVFQHVKTNNGSHLSPYIVDFLHPALLLAAPEVLDPLIDTFISVTPSIADLELYAQIGASVFVCYTIRSSSLSQRRLEDSLNKLLQWMEKLPYENLQGIDTMIDSFNFIICYSSNSHSINQEVLHQRFKENFLSLDIDVQKSLIFNIPRQSFVTVPKPLFVDVLPDAPPQTFQPAPNIFQPPPPPPPDNSTLTDYSTNTIENSLYPQDATDYYGDDYGWFYYDN